MEYHLKYGIISLSQEVIDKIDPLYLSSLPGLLNTLLILDIDSQDIEKLLLSSDHAIYSLVTVSFIAQQKLRKRHRNNHDYRLVELVNEKEKGPRVYIEGKPYHSFYEDIHLFSEETRMKLEEEVRNTPLVRLHHNCANKEEIETAVQRINQTEGYRVMNYSVFSDSIGGDMEIKVSKADNLDSEVISDYLHSILGPSNYLIEFVSYSFEYNAYFWKDYRLTKGGIVVSRYNPNISTKTIIDALKCYSFINIRIVEEQERVWMISFETRCFYPAQLFDDLCQKGIPVLGISGNIERLFGEHSSDGVKLKIVPISEGEESEESIMWDIKDGYGEYHGY